MRQDIDGTYGSKAGKLAGGRKGRKRSHWQQVWSFLYPISSEEAYRSLASSSSTFQGGCEPYQLVRNTAPSQDQVNEILSSTYENSKAICSTDNLRITTSKLDSHKKGAPKSAQMQGMEDCGKAPEEGLTLLISPQLDLMLSLHPVRETQEDLDGVWRKKDTGNKKGVIFYLAVGGREPRWWPCFL